MASIFDQRPDLVEDGDRSRNIFDPADPLPRHEPGTAESFQPYLFRGLRAGLSGSIGAGDQYLRGLISGEKAPENELQRYAARVAPPVDLDDVTDLKSATRFVTGLAGSAVGSTAPSMVGGIGGAAAGLRGAALLGAKGAGRSVAGAAGAYAGAYTAAFPQEAGELYHELTSSGFDHDTAARQATKRAIVSASLEAAVPALVANPLARYVLGSSRLLTGTLGEAATETAQEAAKMYFRSEVDPDFDWSTREVAKELKTAALGGALGGGILTTPAAVLDPLVSGVGRGVDLAGQSLGAVNERIKARQNELAQTTNILDAQRIGSAIELESQNIRGPVLAWFREWKNDPQNRGADDIGALRAWLAQQNITKATARTALAAGVEALRETSAGVQQYIRGLSGAIAAPENATTDPLPRSEAEQGMALLWLSGKGPPVLPRELRGDLNASFQWVKTKSTEARTDLAKKLFASLDQELKSVITEGVDNLSFSNPELHKRIAWAYVLQRSREGNSKLTEVIERLERHITKVPETGESLSLERPPSQKALTAGKLFRELLKTSPIFDSRVGVPTNIAQQTFDELENKFLTVVDGLIEAKVKGVPLPLDLRVEIFTELDSIIGTLGVSLSSSPSLDRLLGDLGIKPSEDYESIVLKHAMNTSQGPALLENQPVVNGVDLNESMLRKVTRIALTLLGRVVKTEEGFRARPFASLDLTPTQLSANLAFFSALFDGDAEKLNDMFTELAALQVKLESGETLVLGELDEASSGRPQLQGKMSEEETERLSEAADADTSLITGFQITEESEPLVYFHNSFFVDISNTERAAAFLREVVSTTGIEQGVSVGGTDGYLGMLAGTTSPEPSLVSVASWAKQKWPGLPRSEQLREALRFAAERIADVVSNPTLHTPLAVRDKESALRDKLFALAAERGRRKFNRKNPNQFDLISVLLSDAVTDDEREQWLKNYGVVLTSPVEADGLWFSPDGLRRTRKSTGEVRIFASTPEGDVFERRHGVSDIIREAERELSPVIPYLNSSKARRAAAFHAGVASVIGQSGTWLKHGPYPLGILGIEPNPETKKFEPSKWPQHPSPSQEFTLLTNSGQIIESQLNAFFRAIAHENGKVVEGVYTAKPIKVMAKTKAEHSLEEAKVYVGSWLVMVRAARPADQEQLFNFAVRPDLMLSKDLSYREAKSALDRELARGAESFETSMFDMIMDTAAYHHGKGQSDTAFDVIENGIEEMLSLVEATRVVRQEISGLREELLKAANEGAKIDTESFNNVFRPRYAVNTIQGAIKTVDAKSAQLANSIERLESRIEQLEAASDALKRDVDIFVADDWRVGYIPGVGYHSSYSIEEGGRSESEEMTMMNEVRHAQLLHQFEEDVLIPPTMVSDRVGKTRHTLRFGRGQRIEYARPIKGKRAQTRIGGAQQADIDQAIARFNKVEDLGNDVFLKPTSGVPLEALHGLPIYAKLSQVKNLGEGTTRFVINADIEAIARSFPDKPWAKPTLQGMTPLAVDTFTSASDWVSFAIEHLKAHLDQSLRKKFKLEDQRAQYEDAINRVALAAVLPKERVAAAYKAAAPQTAPKLVAPVVRPVLMTPENERDVVARMLETGGIAPATLARLANDSDSLGLSEPWKAIQYPHARSALMSKDASPAAHFVFMAEHTLGLTRHELQPENMAKLEGTTRHKQLLSYQNALNDLTPEDRKQIKTAMEFGRSVTGEVERKEAPKPAVSRRSVEPNVSEQQAIINRLKERIAKARGVNRIKLEQQLQDIEASMAAAERRKRKAVAGPEIEKKEGERSKALGTLVGDIQKLRTTLVKKPKKAAEAEPAPTPEPKFEDPEGSVWQQIADGSPDQTDKFMEMIDDPKFWEQLDQDDGRDLSLDKLNPNRQIKPEERKKIALAAAKMLGKQVRLVFKGVDWVLDDGTKPSGRFRIKTDAQTGQVYDIIELSIAAQRPMSVLFHEAMHGLLQRMSANADAQKYISKLAAAVSAPQVIEQMKKLLPASTHAQIDASPMERIAYAFQLFATNNSFNLSPEPRTWFGRLAKAIRELLGIMAAHTAASLIFQAFQEGKFSDQHMLIPNLQTVVPKTRFDRFVDVMEPVLTGYEKFIATADTQLRMTKNEALIHLADTFRTEVGAQGKRLGWLQKRFAVQSLWMNKLADILHNTTPGSRAEATEQLLRQKAGDKLSPLAKRIRGLLDELYDYIEKAGVKRWMGYNVEENEPVWGELKKRQRYYPVSFNKEYVYGHKDDFITMLLRNKLATSRSTGEQVWNRVVRGHGVLGAPEGQFTVVGEPEVGSPNEYGTKVGYTPLFGSAQARAMNKLYKDPEFLSFVDRDLVEVMTRYIRQAVYRSEYTRLFGMDGEKLRTIIERAKSTGATEDQIDIAVRYIRAAEGSVSKDVDPSTHKMMGWITVYQNIRLLPLAVFSSFVDPFGLWVRGAPAGVAFQALLGGLGDLFKSEDSFFNEHKTEVARMLGTIDSTAMLESIGDMYGSVYYTPLQRKVNNALFWANRMERWNASMRSSATSAAIAFIETNAKDAKSKKGLVKRRAERYLKELNLDHNAIPRDKAGELDLKSETVQEAIHLWVDEAILRPTAADRPLWASHPVYQIFFHLKQFTYSFQKYILGRAYHELNQEEGNNGPLWALASYIPVMFLSDYSRGLLQGLGDQPAYRGNWTAGDWLANSVQRAGLTGVSQFALDTANDKDYGGMGFESIMGPAASQMSDALQTAFGNKRAASFISQALPGSVIFRHW